MSTINPTSMLASCRPTSLRNGSSTVLQQLLRAHFCLSARWDAAAIVFEGSGKRKLSTFLSLHVGSAGVKPLLTILHFKPHM